ncbi:MAG TPA: alpha-galactosidase [Ktedonobacteraceae bacterium]|nr:alpha-galactosidase [Ktedonobacteraceae bacterium]
MNDFSRTLLATGISVDETGTIWALVTERSTYALGVTETGLVHNLHWGQRLTSLADVSLAASLRAHSSQDPLPGALSEEYPAFGGLRYGELAARVEFADGVRDLDLRYERFELAVEADSLPCLTLYLRDSQYPLTVALRYQVDVAHDLIIRSATFLNAGEAPVRLERAFSAAWHLPPNYAPRVLTTLAGQWAEEMQIQRRPMVVGTTLLESRRGITSATAAPWLMIETQPTPGLPLPETYFGSLAWSGNWMIRVTTDITGKVSLVGGVSEHDFAWRLAPGESFATPDFVAGFTTEGENGVRHRLHGYVRQHILPAAHRERPRPVLYNSWEATLFDVHEAGQIRLAERAARLGVELFVVDDGWFVGRVNDTAGLGDWRTDPAKFPRGLGPLIERVNELGMDFGLWVEPEMVNPQSELYRAHPEWVYAFPTRARSEARNQLVLNLGREDVRAYLFASLDALLAAYPIMYIKWDMNRPLSEPGWMDYLEQGGEARELWVRHVQGVYSLMDALRARYPRLSIESCASGGGRADLGILRRTDQVWTSDNTFPEARLLIQEGFSLTLPARVMGAWVTDAGRGNLPMAFRFHVSMLGALGIGGNLIHWSDEELDEAARWIAIYKELRPLIQGGQQSWLLSPHASAGRLAAVQYTSPGQDSALVFLFSRSHTFFKALPPLRLSNLKPAASYRVRRLSIAGEEEQAELFSGTALMVRGLPALLTGPHSFASCLLQISQVTDEAERG